MVSTIELDPWGGETNRSSNEAFQPRKFTTYARDSIGSDDAMHRRYNRWWARFEQPDPYGGSYNLADPQSFNRISYVQNDPVTFVDPSGLLPSDGQCQGAECPWNGGAGFWGWGDLMNRPHSREWELGDKPRALQCPPGQLCFWEPLDDKRFKLLIFDPSDFRPRRDIGPTRRNAELDRRSYYRSKYNDCVDDANREYAQQEKELGAQFVGRAYGLDSISSTTTLITGLGGGLYAARGLAGKAALGAAAKGATRGVPVGVLINFAVAYAETLPPLYAYSQAHESRLQGCYSMWHKF